MKLKNKNTEIGIIGFGHFGRFIASHLNKTNKVFVRDKINKYREAQKIGIISCSQKEAVSKDIVILAVPISKLKNVLFKIKPHLRKESIVVDVCSVKVLPCKLMKRMLPDNEIIGTHPLFGPQSGKQGIENMKIVVCPVRASPNSLNKIKNIFNRLGLRIIISSPQEHDKAMASSHALMHFIARSLLNIGITNQEIKIQSLDKALELIDIFKDDSSQLFRDVQNFNPFAKKIRHRFIKEILKINRKLD